MALEIVIPVEALWALIAAERTISLRILRWNVVTVHLLHSSVSAVVVHWHAVGHAIHERKLPVGVADVGEHRSKGRIGERGAMLLVVVCRSLRVEGGNGTVTIDW